MAPIPTALHPTEAAFMEQVVRSARVMGWESFHDYATNVRRRCQSCGAIIKTRRNVKGFPDLVLVRDRVLFRETKVKGAKLEPEQIEWRDRLLAAGADWAVWTPDMWDQIEEELR